VLNGGAWAGFVWGVLQSGVDVLVAGGLDGVLMHGRRLHCWFCLRMCMWRVGERMVVVWVGCEWLGFELFGIECVVSRKW